MEIYDLKGSYVNRTVRDSLVLETAIYPAHLMFFRMLQAFANVKTRKVGSTMKDGDLHEKLYLEDAQRKDLIARLHKDAKFLEKHQIGLLSTCLRRVLFCD